jgi:TRAP-type uncharacterized transport system fused permease subunit
MVTLTGLGQRIGSGIFDLVGNSVFLALVCAMFTSLILGMGVSTTSNYLITSTIAAPILIKAGIPLLAAHMFCFYFGIVADITPPVALAAYAGSAIAKGNAFKTGVNATKLAIAAFLIPYMFAFNPAMIMIEGGDVVLAGSSKGLLERCSALVTERATATLTDCRRAECRDAATVRLMSGTLTDHGHLAITAYNGSTVYSISTKKITLVAGATVKLLEE